MAAIVVKLETITILQSINHPSKRSILNVRGLTGKTQQIVAVSPAAVINNATNRNHRALVISQPTEEDKTRGTKQIRSDNEAISYTDGSGDGSEFTMLTTGSESQSVQYDPENGVESKQHHDHQTGLDQQIQ